MGRVLRAPAYWFARSTSLRAVRDGLVWLLPALLVASMAIFATALLHMLGVLGELGSLLQAVHAGITRKLPYLVCIAIAYLLSLKYRLPSLPTAFLCFAYLSMTETVASTYSSSAAHALLFLAILLPPFAVPALAWLYRQPWCRLLSNYLAGENLRNTINLILPGLALAVLLLPLLIGLFKTFGPGPGIVDLFANPDWIGGSPLESGSLYVFLNSILWFFGIHGAHALLPFTQALEHAVDLNATALAYGQAATHPVNASFLGAFAFVGGSGATLALALAILLFTQMRSLRLIALASLPLSLFNINEILLFALPVIFNFRLLIPFLLAPMAGLVVALYAQASGLIAPVTVAYPYTGLIGLNAYMASGGDWAAVALQACILTLDVLIYLPFVRRIAAHAGEHRAVYFRALDTVYDQLHEDTIMYGDDPVESFHQMRRRKAEVRERIEALSEFEFRLEYQPQVNPAHHSLTGCEALLRMQGPDGRAIQPQAFIDALTEAGLMKSVDLWVAKTATAQHLDWIERGQDIAVTINLTADSLCDLATIHALVEAIRPARGRVSVEITEQSLVVDRAQVHEAIALFHGIGARVYIDDFGTGYSSLSYLHQYDVDVIKIDRSFVLAMASVRGGHVMEGILRFADSLGLGTVIEGVEEQSQIDRLTRTEQPLNIQGWFYSKSLRPDRLFEYAQHFEATARAALPAPTNAGPIIATASVARAITDTAAGTAGR